METRHDPGKLRVSRGPNPEQAGFTLVELLIAIAVSAIVLVSVISLFVFQQRTYTQQSELAHDQAQLRSALQLMGRDLRQAGYTGLALGTERQNTPPENAANQLYPLKAWPAGTSPGGTALFGTSEAIEIWGNLTPNRAVASVSGNYTAGTNTFTVLWPRDKANAPQHILVDNHIKRILVGGNDTIGYYEIIGLVDGATSSTAQITVSPNLAIDLHNGDVVAPIVRRIYLVAEVTRTEGAFSEKVGALIQRTYMVNPANSPANYTDTCYVDEQLADRISLMNLHYSLTVLNAGGAPDGKLDVSPDTTGAQTNNPTDPCRVRSINLHLVGITPAALRGQGGTIGRTGTGSSPFIMDYAQDIQPRNVGILSWTCTTTNTVLSAFTEQACNLSGSTYGL